MKPVLILQHQTPEYPAYLATWLQERSIPYKTFNAAVEDFPHSIVDYSALAVMGGGMSANDPLPSNRQAEILILHAMCHNVPVVGHCLGGQLMAKALGGTVGPSPQPEIGWHKVEWLDNPLTREWFGPRPTSHVIHWHYEAFSLPEGATPLASSPACPWQAFTIDGHIAMQFHIEMDYDKVDHWVNDPDDKWMDYQAKHSTVHSREKILDDRSFYLKNHMRTADAVYSRWLRNTTWGRSGFLNK